MLVSYPVNVSGVVLTLFVTMISSNRTALLSPHFLNVDKLTFIEDVTPENLDVELRQISPDRNVTLREGDVWLLSCDVWNTAPSVGKLSYQWTKNGHPIGVEKTQSIGPITKENEYHATYSCRTGNGEQWGSASITLDFDYGPRLRGTIPPTGQTSADQGSQVLLACHFEGRPSPNVTWHLISKTSKPIHTGSNFTIQSLSSSQAGPYFCCGQVPRFEASCYQIIVNMNDKPKVEVPLLTEAAVGDTVEIPCRVTATPIENKVNWYRSNCDSEWVPLKKFLSTKAAIRYADYYEKKNDKVQHAILKIINVHGTDFGCYNCSAKNQYGLSSASTKLVEINETSVFLMISGVIGGLVAILAIALAYFCLNKKYLCHKKKSLMQSDRTSNLTSSDAESPYYEQIDMPRGSMAYIWDGLAYHPVFITDEPPPPELLDSTSAAVLQNFQCIPAPPSDSPSPPDAGYHPLSDASSPIRQSLPGLMHHAPDSSSMATTMEAFKLAEPQSMRRQSASPSTSNSGSSVLSTMNTNHPLSYPIGNINNTACPRHNSATTDPRRSSMGVYAAISDGDYPYYGALPSYPMTQVVPHHHRLVAATDGGEEGAGPPMIFYVANASSLIKAANTNNDQDLNYKTNEGDSLISKEDDSNYDGASTDPSSSKGIQGALSSSPERHGLLAGQRRMTLETVQEVPSPEMDLLTNQ